MKNIIYVEHALSIHVVSVLFSRDSALVLVRFGVSLDGSIGGVAAHEGLFWCAGLHRGTLFQTNNFQEM